MAVTPPVNCHWLGSGKFQDPIECPSEVYYRCSGGRGWLIRCVVNIFTSSFLKKTPLKRYLVFHVFRHLFMGHGAPIFRKPEVTDTVLSDSFKNISGEIFILTQFISIYSIYYVLLCVGATSTLSMIPRLELVQGEKKSFARREV